MLRFVKTRIFFSEVLLGIGLGISSLTAFRIFGPVGFGEIFIAISVFFLLITHGNCLFNITRDYNGYFVLYFLFVVFLIQPLFVFLWFFLFSNNYPLPVEYVFSFMVSALIVFLLFKSLVEKNINLNVVTFFYCIAFLFSNLYMIFFGGGIDDNIRFKGGSNNPNQLIFYINTLILMLFMYYRGALLKFFSIPFLLFIGYESGSDAFYLSVFFVFVSYIDFKLLSLPGLSVRSYLSALFAVNIVFVLLFLIVFYDFITSVWYLADEGGSRTALFLNAFKAASLSPFFGWGVGSYSGLDVPFSGAEAHNTFLDLSMSFGFPFAIFLYLVILRSLYIMLRCKDFFVASLTIGFLIPGLFHFEGRHFVYWVEVALLISYSSLHSKNLKANSPGFI